MKKLFGRFLCLIGKHDWEYLPSPEGIMDGILFGPRRCKRCPKHFDGFPDMKTPVPVYKQNCEQQGENTMPGPVDTEPVILVIWKELDNGKYHVDEFSHGTCEDADRYIFNGILKDENIKLEYVIRGKDFKNYYLERSQNARISVSDSYDPEFGTTRSAYDVKDGIKEVANIIKDYLGPELKDIVAVSRWVNSHHKTITFSERQLRLIRFCLNRALDSI